MSSIYQDCKAAGLQMDHHESDLYVRDTPRAREILRAHGKSPKPFIDNIDQKQWLEVPFAWEGSRLRPNRLPPPPPMRQHSAHTPSLRASEPRESSLERVRRIAREHDKTFDPSKRGTWQGSSRDLVVNPSKRFKQATGRQVDRESDSPEDEFLVIEEDRGNGTLEWVLVNPFDYPRAPHSSHDKLFAFGFGAYGTTRLLMWGHDLEDALEEAAEWLEKYAPGHLATEQDIAPLLAEALEEDPDLSEEEAYEKATADLTYTESGYLTSYEWTVDDVRSGSELYLAALRASELAYREEFDDEYRTE